MLSSDRRNVEKDAAGHGINCHGAEGAIERNRAEAVGRSLRTDRVQVREVRAAEVAHVDPSQRHVHEVVGVSCLRVRPCQELLDEGASGERKGIRIGDAQLHFVHIIIDRPSPGCSYQLGFDEVRKLRAAVDLADRQLQVVVRYAHFDLDSRVQIVDGRDGVGDAQVIYSPLVPALQSQGLREGDGDVAARARSPVSRVHEDLSHLLKDETYIRAVQDARPAGPLERSHRPEEQEGACYQAEY